MIFLKKHGAHFDEKYLWDQLRPIIPYPTGRFFRGTLSQALRARLRSVLSLRDALADISQQHLANTHGREHVLASNRQARGFEMLIAWKQMDHHPQIGKRSSHSATPGS